MEKLNKELAKKGGTVIGVNSFTLDGDKTSISEAKDVLTKKGITYKNIWFDSKSEAGKFASGLYSYPTTYVVDKNGNIVFSLHKGEILIVAPMSYKPEYITIYTPDNSTINISGAAIVSYNAGITKVQFLHGYGKLNNAVVGQFIEVNLKDGTTKDMVMSAYLRNRINEILRMQYIERVAQANVYKNIAKLSDSATFNVKQVVTPIGNNFFSESK